MTKAQYLSWFDEVVGPTASTFRLVPSDKLDWKLTESSFTNGQLLRHIPGALSFMANVVKKREGPAPTFKDIMVANRHHESATVEEALTHLAASTAMFKQAVSDLGEGEFQGEQLDTPQLGRTHYWRYCAFTLEHHIHHLMELHINLKVLGVRVNTRTLYAG